jgi:hypothetical protein
MPRINPQTYSVNIAVSSTIGTISSGSSFPVVEI